MSKWERFMGSNWFVPAFLIFILLVYGVVGWIDNLGGL